MSTDTHGVTPFRKTHVRFDFAENTLREPAMYYTRTAHEIALGHTGQEKSSNWHYLDTGAITVRPWQDDPSNIHEKTPPAATILRLADYNTVAGMTESPTFRAPTDLPGVTVDPSVQASGDHFMRKTVNADGARPDGTWAQTMTPDISAFGQVSTSSNVTLDRVAVSRTVLAANQGFSIRIVVPGGALQAHQSLGAVYFGGPISTDTNVQPTGVYAVEFMGSGQVKLHMRKSDGAGGWRFSQLSSWQGFHLSSGSTVYCRVWPHYTAQGQPCIEFRTDYSGASGHSTSGGGGLVQSLYQPPANHSLTHIWYGWRKPSGPARPPVTGPGPIRHDTPRAIRPAIQASIIKHISPATVQDDPFTFNFFPQPTHITRLSWQASIPSGTSIDGRLYDTSTDAELTPTGTGPNYREYSLNDGKYSYYAKFTMTPSADGNATPFLYSYRVGRDSTYALNSPGEFIVPDTYPLAALRDLSISGPDKDLTHETASATITDVAANLSKINIRAGIRTRIETEYDPADPAKRSVLFDGYVQRADGKLKGWKGKVGLNQQSAVTSVYPNAAWKEFGLTFTGVWTRLRENLSMERISLYGDTDPATGQDQPFKVTDICRSLLNSRCGFALGEIDVPDSPIRFYPGSSGDDATIEPLTEVGDLVAGFLNDYLGWFLIWDGNAGTTGKIRAIKPPPFAGPYNVLAKFTLDAAAAGKLQYRPESYGSTGWYTTGPSTAYVLPVCPIRKRTFQTHVKPPEANAVHVTSTGNVLPNKAGQYRLDQWAFNPKSYDFFVDGGGFIVPTADPADPDYLGRFVPLVVVNTALGDYTSISLLTRRLYDVACRAQKWAMFDAPLCLVLDKNDANRGNPRPLRYYDAVSIISGGAETTWIVRSCNPYLLRGKDGLQFAHYELQEAPTSS